MARLVLNGLLGWIMSETGAPVSRHGSDGLRRMGTARLLLFCLALFPAAAVAQFAIQTHVNVARFSPFLEDYAEPGRTVVTLLSIDQRPSYDVLLRLRISGAGFTLYSDPARFGTPITLSRNQPVVLTGAALRPYFALDNLLFQGLTLRDYLAAGNRLPAGPVSVCVELYDVNRPGDPPVSNVGCANGLIQVHRPPTPLTPDATAAATNPQALLFSWLPQHFGFAAAYSLDLWERTLDLPDNILIETTPPLRTVETFATTYLYTDGDPLLTPGRDYVWRVRARDLAGFERFQNEGYSPPARFAYRPAALWPGCGTELAALAAVPISADSARISWTFAAEPPARTPVRLRYRNAADTSLVWRERLLSADSASATLDSLLAQTTYELELCLVCPRGREVCRSIEFTTPSAGGCASPPTPPILADLTGSRALVGWPADSLDRPVELHWKPAVRPYWSRALASDTFQYFDPADYDLDAGRGRELGPLQPGLNYVARRRYVCADSLWSDWSEPVTFNADCAVVDTLHLAEVTDSTARISGVAVANALTYIFAYRHADAGAWREVAAGPDPTLLLTGLAADTDYEVRLRYACTLGPSSDYTRPLVFRTPPRCDSPREVVATPLAYTAADLSWTPAAAGVATELRYRPRSEYAFATAPWQTAIVADSLAQLSELRTGTTYEYQLRADCASQFSTWTPAATFSTDCGPPTGLAVDSLRYDYALLRPGPAAGGWAPFELEVRADQDTPWIAAAVAYGVGVLTGLEGSTRYTVRSRRRCATGDWSPVAEVGAFTTPVECRVPNGLTVTDRGVFHAALAWQTTGSLDHWEVFVRDPNVQIAPAAVALDLFSDPAAGIPPTADPFAEWRRETAYSADRLLDSLRADTEYRTRVRGYCDGFGYTEPSTELSFRTRTDCGVPDTSFVDRVYEESVRINWSAGRYTSEYRVQLERGASAGKGIAMNRDPTQTDSLQTSGQSATFTGLQPNTDYRYRISGYCDNYGWTDYGPWRAFRTDECRAPEVVLEEPVDRSTFRLSWPPSAGENQYEFQYRLAEPGAGWITRNTALTTVELTELRGSAIYEYQITEVCAGGGRRTTPLDSFRMERPTLAGGTYQCGLPPGEVDLSNMRPLPRLAVGDTIRAFDFDIVVTSAYGSGGTFGGAGEIRIPYFQRAKFAFTFDRLVINDEYRVVGGYLRATGFGVEILGPAGDAVLAGILDLLGDLDGLLAEGQVDELQALLDCCADQLDPALAVQIQAAVDCLNAATTPEQRAACQGLLDAATAISEGMREELLAADFQVAFVADPTPAFGFDGSRPPAPEEWYEQLAIAGAPYAVAYQSVAPGETATVVAVLPPGVVADSVRFTQAGGLPVGTTVRGDSIWLEFVGQPGAPYYLAAEQLGADSAGAARIAGLLRIVPYAARPLEVVLIPLNGATPPTSAADLTDQLAEILGQAVVRPTVTLAAPFYPADYDGRLDAAPSGLLANYAPEMRDLIREYENQVGVDPETYYLFLVENHEATDRAGFMPRGRSYGFLYLGNAGSGPAFARTLAHELAHGAYVLEHTFEAYPAELPRNSTDNLMDYAGGTELDRWQWELVRDPVGRPWLGGDEGGMMLGNLLALDSRTVAGHEQDESFRTDATTTFVTPGGELFTLPSDAIAYVITCEYAPYYLPIGSLLGYTYQGKYYSSIFYSSTQRFIGYAEIYPTGTQPPFSDQYQEGLTVAADENGRITVHTHQLMAPDDSFSVTTIARFTATVDQLPVHDGNRNDDTGGIAIIDEISFSDLIEIPTSRMVYDGRCGYPEFTEEFTVNICNEVDDATDYSTDEIDALAQAFTAGIAARRNYPLAIREKGAKLHLLATPGSRVALAENEIEVFEDHFFLLKERTDLDFFVLFHRRAEVLSKPAAEALLATAISRAGLPEAGVFVLVPYASSPYAGTCGTPVYQVQGDVQVGAIDLETPEGANTAGDFILHVFANVRKPLHLANLLVLTDGSIFNYQIEHEGIIGFPFLDHVNFYESTEIAYRRTLVNCNVYPPLIDSDYTHEALRMYFNCTDGNKALIGISDEREQLALDRLFEATSLKEKLSLLAGQDWQRWEHGVDLRPSFIQDQSVLLSYAAYHQFSLHQPWLANVDYLLTEHIDPEEVYDSELHSYTAIDWYTVIDPVVYGAIDLIGLVPLIGDFADGVGVLYASVVRHDPENTLLYGASFAALGGFSNLLFKTTVKRYVVAAEYTENGVDYVVKNLAEIADPGDIRYSTLARNRAEAEQILLNNSASGNSPIWPADAIYASTNLGLPKNTLAERATAKLISQHIYRYAPRLAADISGKLPKQLGDILRDIPTEYDRARFLTQLDELDRTGRYVDWAEDLSSSGLNFTNFFRDNYVEGINAWKVLSNSAKELRVNPEHLDQLIAFSNRFRYQSFENWEALTDLFSEVEVAKHDEILYLLKKADKDFDNNDLWGVKAFYDENGDLGLEIEGGITYTPLSKPVVGDLSITSLSEDEFDLVVYDLTAPHIDPSKPGARLILGNDNPVLWGEFYPTQPGILDIHVHGAFQPILDGYPTSGEHVIVAKISGVLLIMKPANLAHIIMSHPSFSEFNAVRLFNCNGIAGGQLVADMIGKPVITSNDFISVYKSGRMKTEHGTMIKLIND